MENDSTLLARASMDTWNRHDLDAYPSFFAAEASYVGARREVHANSRIRSYMKMLMEAFPDEEVAARDYSDLYDVLFVQLGFPFPEPRRTATISECPASK